MELNFQYFFELIKEKKMQEAIEYSQKILINYKSTHQELINRSMMLLVLSIDSPLLKNYKDLLSEERWKHLNELFIRDLYRIHSITSDSQLTLSLHAGLISLKTIFCDNPKTKNTKCPTCDEIINELAKELPLNIYSNSQVVCKITGEIIDDSNPPMVLPNGNVYSEKVSLYRELINVHNQTLIKSYAQNLKLYIILKMPKKFIFAKNNLIY